MQKDPTYRLTKDGKVYRKGRKTYANLDVYEGEFLDGMKHGRGQLVSQNGDRYTGEFAFNQPHGFGTMVWAPYTGDDGVRYIGKRYEGDWCDGLKHGKGVFLIGNGDYYSGMFEKNLYHGEGILKKRNGDTYNGNWARGRASGKMVIEYMNGDRYEGEMQIGAYHGKGKLVFRQNMGFYEGDFERGKAHGRGTRQYSNGSRYIGDFQDGEVHGSGIMFYANGDHYVGAFTRGQLSGKGVLKYARGDIYEGSFLCGVFYGEGKYTWSDGGYYDGEYRATKINRHTDGEAPLCNGLRHGWGMRVFSNGSKYRGQWREDKMEGDGELEMVDGGRYEGQFFNNFKHGHGVQNFGNKLGIPYICPMGHRHAGNGFCVYTGSWKADYFEGEGEFSCVDGRVYKGSFSKGQRHGLGTQEYLREGDMGDLDRQCIGGRGSMYRTKLYVGEWVGNVREGNGKLYYVNGDYIEGSFLWGQPHGIVKYHFVKKKRVRLARYVRGVREAWIEEKVREASNIISFLMRDAKDHRLIRETDAIAPRSR